MASLGTVNNKDGLVVQMSGDYQKFNGPYNNRLRAINTVGPFKYYVMDFDLETVGASTTFFPHDLNNDGTRDGFHVGEAYLPAGSCITRGYVITKEVAVGGTDFTVGTYTVAGATTDADAIVDATDGAIANMSVVGERIDISGALLTSTTAAVTADAYVAITTNGTFTAGKGTLVIEVLNV